jgi:hypothetical protein
MIDLGGASLARRRTVSQLGNSCWGDQRERSGKLAGVFNSFNVKCHRFAHRAKRWG